MPLSDGILSFPAYPTASSLGLGNIAFKNSLVIADIANLQSDLDNKQQAISVISANLSSHIGDSTIHITANERIAWNNKWDYNEATIKAVKVNSAINADNATKLLTTRTIWGQSFDGTANVSGALTGATTIEASTSIKIGNATISWDSKYGCLKVDKGLYSTDFLSSGGKSDTEGAGSGTVTGIKIGDEDIITPINGILNIPPYPTTTSLGLKNLAFKDSLAVSEVVGLQSALSNKQDAATAITTSNIGSQSVNYATNAGTIGGLSVDSFVRRDTTQGFLDYFDLQSIPRNVTQVGSIGWSEYQTHRGAGGMFLTFCGKSSLRSLLLFAPDYNNNDNIEVYTSVDNGIWQGMRKLAWTSDIPTNNNQLTNGAGYITSSGSCAYATSAGSAPASDVYAWAKASSKPSYSFSEITSKPTTISGYGITDAYTASTIDSKLSEYLRGEVLKAYDANNVYNFTYRGFAGGANTPSGAPYGSLLTLPYRTLANNTTPDFAAQIFIPSGDDPTNPNDMFFRTSISKSWNVWQKVITSSNIGSHNAGSATKLATPRTIWGQSFDGTGNVDGILNLKYSTSTAGIELTRTNNTECSIAFNTNGKRFVSGVWADMYHIWTGIANNIISVTENGNVGIGINPSARLHVAGNAIITGDTATGSDIRFKDIIKDHRIALESIAQAPLFTFKWKDRDDDAIHLGTSAQYWEVISPWLVKGTDFKVLDYSTLGVAIGISLANKTVNLEERVKILERENEQLKKQIYGS